MMSSMDSDGFQVSLAYTINVFFPNKPLLIVVHWALLYHMGLNTKRLRHQPSHKETYQIRSLILKAKFCLLKPVILFWVPDPFEKCLVSLQEIKRQIYRLTF